MASSGWQLVAWCREQCRDAGGVEIGPRRRILEPGERALHAVDVLDGIEAGREIEDPLDVALVERRAIDGGKDDVRGRLARLELRRQGDRGLATLDAGRQDRCVGDALAQPQERCPKDEQERERRDEHHDRSRHDPVGHALPTRLSGDHRCLAHGATERATDAVAESAHTHRVDAVPEHAEDRREERQGEEHRRGHRQRPADPERAQGRRLEEQQAGQSHGDSEAGERDGLAARRDRDRDGRSDIAAAPELLTEPADHEQRVVDRESQAEHRGDVLDVDRELGDLRREVDATERRRDRQRGDEEWHARGDERGEDQDQDQGREREGHRLRLEQLLLGLDRLVLCRRGDACQLQRHA